MKRVIFALVALAMVACAKNDVEAPKPDTQILNLTISDFPALEGATRSDEVYGKTAWEAGDELLIHYYQVDEVKMTPTLISEHKATYDGSAWSIDPVIEINAEHVKPYLQVYYRQGLKWKKQGDSYYDWTSVTEDEQEPTVVQLAQSEFLCVFNLIQGDNHHLTFSKIVDGEGRLISSVLQRSNRIRFQSTTSNAGNQVNIGGPQTTVSYSMADLGYSSKLDENTSFTIDDDGNIIVYLYWDENSILPQNYGTPKLNYYYQAVVNLPYGENDSIDAPYPYTEYGAPIFGDDIPFPHHYNAYAYSVIITSQ